MTSLRGVAPPRTVFSEYHAAGSITGAFMVRHGSFKYVYYVGMPPQLFDLEADPLRNAGSGPGPGLAGVVADMRGEVAPCGGSRRHGRAGP